MNFIKVGKSGLSSLAILHIFLTRKIYKMWPASNNGQQKHVHQRSQSLRKVSDVISLVLFWIAIHTVEKRKQKSTTLIVWWYKLYTIWFQSISSPPGFLLFTFFSTRMVITSSHLGLLLLVYIQVFCYCLSQQDSPSFIHQTPLYPSKSLSDNTHDA